MSVSRKRAQKENKLSASEHEMKRERNRQRQVERSQKVIIRVGQPADRYWGDVLLFRCDWVFLGGNLWKPLPEQMINMTIQWHWLGRGQCTVKSSFFILAWFESNIMAAWQSVIEGALEGRMMAYFKIWTPLKTIQSFSLCLNQHIQVVGKLGHHSLLTCPASPSCSGHKVPTSPLSRKASA